MTNADYGDYGGYASHARPRVSQRQDFRQAAPLRASRVQPAVTAQPAARAARPAAGYGYEAGGYQAGAQGYPDQGYADQDYAGQDYAGQGYAAQPVMRLSRGQRMVNIAGAVGSVALVISLAWWGWELAVRDVRGVPVVRALEGPMRTSPTEGGGMIVDHQGLAVNDVAAKDGGNGSDRVVLAPAPVELTAEDVAGLAPAGGAALAAVAPAPAMPAEAAPVTRMSAAEESPLPLETTAPPADAPVAAAEAGQPATISQDEAVALALAEALGMDDSASAELVAAAAPAAPPGAMTSSPRPRLRPQSGGAPQNVVQTAAATPATVAAAGAVKDPSTIEPGARLVQFGAYDSEAQAQAEWAKIAARLGPLMADKAMVVQSAESGGHTFWRLRGFGFASEDDARRFCSAAVAEQINCIPVTQR